MGASTGFRRYAICFLVFLLCLAASPVWAVSVTFVNEPAKDPDLFVTKTVESAVEGREVPDDVFTFLVKVNGSAYKDEYYSLSTDGVTYSEYDGEGNAYRTDGYGRFHLKAGQTARFAYVGRNAVYEVSEEPAEGYSVSPAGGVASGVIQDAAVSVEFKNTYVPGSDVPGKKGEFRVYKSVAFPDGLHAPEGPDFSFVLTLDGEVHAGEAYSVYEAGTDRLAGTGFTDVDGGFVLKADQYAVFKDVPSSVDYKVEEVLDEGSTWHAVGDRIRQGATAYPLTRVDFTNAEASLAVAKAMQDGESAEGEAFTFTLVDGSSRSMAGVPYYLYGRSGYPVDGEVRHTNEAGQFDLEAGQTAVLLGIGPGTLVSVREEPKSGYEQVSPGTSGYRDIEVSDYPGTYRFVNRSGRQAGTLSVSKTVQNEIGTEPTGVDTFNFVLEKYADGAYVPVSGAVYSIKDGDSQRSYKTGKDGKFSLKANQLAMFEFLEVGATYRATEVLTGISKAYSSLGEDSMEAVLTAEGASFAFLNRYSPDLRLNIRKTDINNDSLALSGVEFELYSDKKLTKLYASGTTDENGMLSFDRLADGTWYLVEKSTADGYVLPVVPYVLKVDCKYPAEGATVEIGGGAVTGVEGNEMNIQIKNSRNVVMGAILPLTGGSGTYVLTASGLLLTAAAGFALWRRKKEGGHDVA